ncbi:BMP family ABC transporter substrate-binding protein [Pelomonas sp. KK5]|uniref:BMP family ABC transporter substrate-binding protein n=1 Tax=Pelomonas sp. KK5 TaxID=1855730 RepID=UPI003515BED0
MHALFKRVALPVLCLALAAGCLSGFTRNANAAEAPKIVFLYSAPVGDAGWGFAHEKARREVQAKFGARIQTQAIDNVADGPDSERVVREAVSQGAKMIVGTSFGYMDPMQHVAVDEPQVKFEHASGYKTAQNMRTFNSRIYEGYYLAGVVAGSMTKTNVLGFVGAVPIPEVIRNLNSFTLGAQSVNPAVTTRIVWTNEWFNPPRETDAANSLINAGADVLMQNTASPAVLQVAQVRGKRAFGVYSDMTAYAPKASLGSAIINWTPYYTYAVQGYLDGTWKTGSSLWGVKEGSVDLVSLASDVPAATRTKLDHVKESIKAGTFAVWTGPVFDQAGKEVLSKGTRATDAYLDSINFLVKGVEGRLPGK